MLDTPQDILIQAQQGDMQAFEKIYAHCCDFVFNIAYKITHDYQDAEEVTQDVFLKIFKHLKGFRFQSSFNTWVYRIAVNTGINAYRKKSKNIRGQLQYDDNIDSQGIAAPQKLHLDKQDTEGLIKSMLDMLNPRQRACIILRDIQGLSYEQISKVLKININTVRSRINRARKTLLVFRQKGVIKNEL